MFHARTRTGLPTSARRWRIRTGTDDWITVSQADVLELTVWHLTRGTAFQVAPVGQRVASEPAQP